MTEPEPAILPSAARPHVDPSTPIYGPFIWLIVLLPLLSLAALFLYQPQFQYEFVGPGNMPVIVTRTVFTPGYLLLLLSGLVVYGLNALFAYLDRGRLIAAGVQRPFPWPWVFLSSPVYVIGRSVIVHRVARPRGLSPIWVLIGVLVVSFVVTIVWTALFVARLVSQLPAPPH